MPNPWVIGELIQGQYLNSLQELLSDWSDNVLLQASGPDVIVSAATHAPAELVIAGQMRYSNTDEEVTISGPAGFYNIFATTRRGRSDFELEASTADVTAQYRRRIGVAEFDGVNVVDVRSDVREINVSHIDGHPPSQPPLPAGIPAGRVDATIDPEWLPGLEDARIMVGGIREVWVPDLSDFVLTPDFVVCLGQTLGPADHGFTYPDGSPFPGSVTVPALVNRHLLGAHPAAGFGSTGSGSGVAPGPNGRAGTNAQQSFLHGHTRTGHSHAVNNHGHSLPSHTHVFGPHYHRVDFPTDPRRLNIVTPGGTNRSHVQRDIGIGPPSNSNIVANSAPSAAPDMNAGAGTTGMGGGEVTAVSPGNQSYAPRSAGYIYVMRVK
jgi:hypothetical protein